jgi:hypothetical protein
VQDGWQELDTKIKRNGEKLKRPISSSDDDDDDDEILRVADIY